MIEIGGPQSLVGLLAIEAGHALRAVGRIKEGPDEGSVRRRRVLRPGMRVQVPVHGELPEAEEAQVDVGDHPPAGFFLYVPGDSLEVLVDAFLLVLVRHLEVGQEDPLPGQRGLQGDVGGQVLAAPAQREGRPDAGALQLHRDEHQRRLPGLRRSIALLPLQEAKSQVEDGVPRFLHAGRGLLVEEVQPLLEIPALQRRLEEAVRLPVTTLRIRGRGLVSRAEVHGLLVQDQDVIDLGRDLIDDPDGPAPGRPEVQQPIAQGQVQQPAPGDLQLSLALNHQRLPAAT